MAALVQFADLLAVHVTAPTDPVCCNEKMASPVVLFKRIGAARVRAHSTIIESDEYWDFRCPRAESLNSSNKRLPPLDSQQVISKMSLVQCVHR